MAANDYPVRDGAGNIIETGDNGGSTSAPAGPPQTTKAQAFTQGPMPVTAAATIFSMDATGYTIGTIQVAATAFVGIIVVEGSNDNVNWNAKALSKGDSVGAATDVTSIVNLAAAGTYQFAAGEKYIRARCSAFTSATALQVSMNLEQGAVPHPRSIFATLAALVLQAGTALIGAVSVGASATVGTGTTNGKVKAAAGTNATLLKAGAGKLYRFTFRNNTAVVKFAKIYNKATLPVPGTDVGATILETVIIPANGVATYLNPIGKAFNNGLGYAITGAIAETDTTAIAADDVVGSIDYI